MPTLNDSAATATATRAVAKPTAAIATAPRYSLYTGVHKGLRALMMDTLLRVSRMDPDDEPETCQALAQLQGLLAMCRGHLGHENEFVHPALERAQPDSALRTADDHVQHLAEIAGLESAIAALNAATGPQRAAQAHHLYLEVSRFVGENFVHMYVEETDNQVVLAAAYSDAELLAIEGAIVAQIPPPAAAQFHRWILPNMNAAERLRAFRHARAGAPPEVFAGLLSLAREVLSERDWYKLERGLQAQVLQ